MSTFSPIFSLPCSTFFTSVELPRHACVIAVYAQQALRESLSSLGVLANISYLSSFSTESCGCKLRFLLVKTIFAKLAVAQCCSAGRAVQGR